ncbi:MAG TPA: hypothetical protein PL151_20390 [Phycisphaerae bacterium]|nr:hypothetical protein [Phycisphaerae bacterium]HQA00222.1 hypothetical protein [Phycisphaerae bacterium]HQE30116.1 hypothetical protein [Phycisphaerae bacterium]
MPLVAASSRVRTTTSVVVAVGTLLAVVAPSVAATITFSLVAVNGSGNNAVVVRPGEEVPYIITALITYEGTLADNAGLAFFSVDIRTDLEVPQLPIDSFDQDIALIFPILQSRGTPSEGPVAGVIQDILQIGGSQDTFSGQPTLGVALLETQVLAQGRLLTPAVEGEFTATILDSTAANVFLPDSNSVFEPEIVFGTPITITTQIPANGGDDDDDDNDGTDDDNQTPTTQPVAVPLIGAAYLTLFAVVAGLIGLALWGGQLFLFMAPILAVILIVMLGLGQWS